ncbi:hypothetical protein [Jeotgalicoccus meleagridis]|uniref:Uncharacterized protein n=2 Tax=Staphylococcaceae TaxID=90964 RepID=A0A6V7RKJ3_9STAP|nr:hypothetical protein [Jeotgalicoccus meleagridis]CAD2078696.1 hypothetical protein JEODO184_01449 [Jeotgalicoccus meleagridis]
MHVYRLYNSLTLEKYQYDEDLNALFYDGFNADYVVDQIGDLSLFYAEMIDDSDWISPQLIKEILIHFKKNRIIENNVTDDIVESIKNDDIVYKPELFNGLGYKCSMIDAGQELREIDLYIADEKARRYYSENQNYKWLSTLPLEEVEMIKTKMIRFYNTVL